MKDFPVLLEAYLDSPFSGTFLTFYENLEFEHKSSGVIRLFETGTYLLDQDTINLSYRNLEKKIYKTEKIIIDKKSNFLIYQNSKGIQDTRFRIMTNQLNN